MLTPANKQKQKKCREKAEGCHGTFIPRSSFQTTCSNLLCGLQKVRRDRDKKEAKAKQDQRREILLRKEKAKSRNDHLKEAQAVFNSWIRKRDERDPCISCGKHTTGQHHAGHFQTTKARPGLRFHPANCHKQCAADNLYHSGRIHDYRPRLIDKVGIKMVEYLEIAHPRSDWTIMELKEIKDYYRQLLKELTNGTK